MKLYDFDGMFDEKLSAYIEKNAGKYKENEWEDIIPQLYKKFGDTVIKSIGKTPREFYGAMSGEELVRCLKAHLKQDVPVPEFLCSAIEEKGAENLLIPLLDGTRDECEYAMNIIGADASLAGKYLDMLIASEDEDMKNRCVDYIKENADAVGERALDNYKKGIEKEYMLEILSRVTQKSDGVFNVLLNEFRGDPENIPMHASYLAAYGDARALDYLLDKIDEDGITFVEYQELKFAIEALGGEYTKERDFSDDPYFKLIYPNG
ncbi:MAG: hypothetical protein K2N30_05980 [Clostridia bacterium]|nr:hypothetical protein [Clostridia bacterium]